MYSDVDAAIHRMDLAVQIAHVEGPKDIFTTTAMGLSVVLRLILAIPVTLMEIPLTFLGGCAISLTFGLLLIPLTVLWLPQLGLLVGTSWLWLRVPILRPLLLLPGVLVAVIADTYVALMPDPEKDSKYAKLTLATEWPLSSLLLQPDRLLARAGFATDADV